ncbi:MAG: hypothetical protein FJW26_02480 [Acidimicrobiia bacterium]|nr:hypothetical protein [Acidimicrobiia bacterium]
MSAVILKKLRESAEEFLGEEVTEAIVTVPAYFDDIQRQATTDAGKIAGLTVNRIINEPTAAALAYGLGKHENEKVVIFDLGGGTFDVSILELNDGVFEVLATGGDSFLGGEDFDQKILDWIVAEFQKENNIDLRSDRLALQRVKEAAERAKCELSSTMEAHINLPFISADRTGPKHFNKLLSRSKFEQMVADLVERTVEPCQKALWDAKLEPKDIDQVILVGGQTRTPLVRERVEKTFGKLPCLEINPDEVVAIGAAIQGGVLKGEIKDIVLLDVIPLSRRRNPRRAVHQVSRSEYHDSDDQNDDVYDRCRKPIRRRDPCFARRARAGCGQSLPGEVRDDRYSGCAPGSSSNRRDL